MACPIVDLMGHDESRVWVEKHFHPRPSEWAEVPEGRGRESAGARVPPMFRQTRQSRLTVYRCACGQTYHLYLYTVIYRNGAGPAPQHHLTPAQASRPGGVSVTALRSRSSCRGGEWSCSHDPLCCIVCALKKPTPSGIRGRIARCWRARASA